MRPDSTRTKSKSKLIEEISSSCTIPAAIQPEYTLTVSEGESKTVRAVVTLPGVKSVCEITLDVSKVQGVRTKVNRPSITDTLVNRSFEGVSSVEGVLLLYIYMVRRLGL